MELIRPNDKLSISINQESPLVCSGSNQKVFTTPAINFFLRTTGQGPNFKVNPEVINLTRHILTSHKSRRFIAHVCPGKCS